MSKPSKIAKTIFILFQRNNPKQKRNFLYVLLTLLSQKGKSLRLPDYIFGIWSYPKDMRTINVWDMQYQIQQILNLTPPGTAVQRKIFL